MHRTELNEDDIELLRAMAEGMSARQIAAQTGRSPRQGQRDVQAVRARLGATTNMHAVAIAVRRGII